jgi:putative protein-disulfide isomerase
MEPVTLYYIHDPMCSWCWAYRPVLDELKARLPGSVVWRNRLGGLAPDSDVPMPEETRKMVMNHWRNIQTKLGTEFNFEFWTRCKPRRSTYPACRAVLAAASQDAEEAMIDAIQRAYYVRALNPSEDDTLVHLAEELGLDTDRFVEDLGDPQTHDTLLCQIGQARAWGVSGFPSLVMQKGNTRSRIPVDYLNAAPTLEAIQATMG